MILGILSDNHGRLKPVNEALKVFTSEGVEAYVHCGDLGGLETLELLAEWPCWFVWGNTDDPQPTWRHVINSLGTHWPESVPVVITNAQCSIAVCHGHETSFKEACMSGTYDYILHGHTHQAADHRIGKTRIINPGALHRVRQKTIAVLDTTTDRVKFFTLQ